MNNKDQIMTSFAYFFHFFVVFVAGFFSSTIFFGSLALTGATVFVATGAVLVGAVVVFVVTGAVTVFPVVVGFVVVGVAFTFFSGTLVPFGASLPPLATTFGASTALASSCLSAFCLECNF